MAIGKNQAITLGEFYPSSDENVIYHCHLNNTRGFLRDITILSIIIGFFAFLIMQWWTFVVTLFSWIFIVPWLVPKHYRFIQINKYVVAFGTGSILALIRSKIKTIYKLEKNKYGGIHYLRLDRWQRKKYGGKMDSFGRIVIKINDNKPKFQILIHTADLSRLITILKGHRFHSKVQKKLSSSELILVFPSSPHFTNA